MTIPSGDSTAYQQAEVIGREGEPVAGRDRRRTRGTLRRWRSMRRLGNALP